MAHAITALYEFGSFRLDAGRRQLIRDGQTLVLPPKTFDLLLLLVESGGRVLTKKELMSALWPDTFVEDANLSFQISALRKALGEQGAEWIETLPRYGYRFSGSVAEAGQNTVSESPAPPPSEPAATPEPARASTHGYRNLRYWLPAAVATIVALTLAVVHIGETRPAERAVRFLISPPERVTVPDGDSIALSPNGERLTFIGIAPDGKKQLWVRALGSLASEVIAGTELVDAAFWSPDSRSLAFFAAGKLKKIDLQSGTTQTICETPVARSSGTWSRHGVILFETTARPEIYRVEAAGGQPRPVTRLESSNRDTRHSAPQFLPDGRHFIYFVESERPENNGVYVGSIDSKNRTRLVNSNASAVYAPMREGPGYLLFARGTTLMGQVLDPAKQELAGNPFVVSQQLVVSFGGGLPRAEMAASENGVLAWRTRLSPGSNDLVWFDRTGKKLGSMSEPADYSNPALSPDEHKLAVSLMDPDTRTRDIWLFDFSNGAFSRFTFDPADETNAAWSPDGKRVAFDSLQNGVIDIYEKEIAGSSEPRVLLHSSENKLVHDWSPDGKFLLFRIGSVTWALAREGGKVTGPFAMDNARISPNGRWVAYTSNQTGRSEVYVQNFPPSEGKWQVSTAGGTEPAWRADGKELFYLSAEKLVAMQVKTESPVFEPGASRALFTIHLEPTVRRSHYQPASNGRRFLVNVPSEATYPITVAIGWAPPRAGSR